MVHAIDVRGGIEEAAAGEYLAHEVLGAHHADDAVYDLLVEGALGEDDVLGDVVERRAARADGVADARKLLGVGLDHRGASAAGDGNDLAGLGGGGDGGHGGGENALAGVEQRPVHVEGNQLVVHVVPLRNVTV